MIEKKMVYYNEGEVVKVKHLPDSPEMVVKRIEKLHIQKEEDKGTLIGIKCFWFDKNMSYQEAVFSTKDLEKVRELEKADLKEIGLKPTIITKKIKQIEGL